MQKQTKFAIKNRDIAIAFARTVLYISLGK